MNTALQKSKNPICRTILFFLLVLCVGIFGFTQAAQVPLSKTAAEKVLAAWNILQGKSALSDWVFNPFEFPVYLICVRIFGLGTYAAITADSCFFLILFSAGILILYAHHLLTPAGLLIWIVLTGIPDRLRMEVIQFAPMSVLGLILLTHFLSAVIEKRDFSKIIYLLIPGILMLFPVRIYEDSGAGRGSAVHKTLRALQKLFKADFSRQPLLDRKTAYYFLMTIVLILLSAVVFRTLVRAFRHDYHPFELISTIAVLITILYCCFIPGESTEIRVLRCAWLPYGASVLLIYAFQRIPSRTVGFKQHNISLGVLAVILLGITSLFCSEPVTFSRPVSPADRVIAFISGRGLACGYCDPPDMELFTVSGKGKIRFTQNREDPENAFLILGQNADDPEKEGETADFGPYHVVLQP